MRFSAFFRVFPRPKKRAQREILCAGADCIARGVDCDPRRAKLPLSRTPLWEGEAPVPMRFSAFFRVLPRPKKKTHPRSQNNLPCLHRSQRSPLCFQPPLTPPHQQFLFRVFRVFRGEPWFPVENTVIEQAHALLARAKAHGTVSGPRCHECAHNPRSHYSASFRVLPRPKKRHTHARKTTCSAPDVHNTPRSASSLP